MNYHQILQSIADEVRRQNSDRHIQTPGGVTVEGKVLTIWRGKERSPLPCPMCGAHPLMPRGDLGELVSGASGRNDAAYGADVPLSVTRMYACPWPLSNCDPILIVGQAHLDLDPFPDPDEGVGQMAIAFAPSYIQPPLSLLGGVGKHVDKKILELGRAAGSVVWIDADAAANKLRSAIEVFLDILGVPSGSARGKRLSLNSRIDEAGKRTSIIDDVKTLLHGLRILGNEGSHGATAVTASHAIEGGRVLSLALRLQFPDPEDDRVKGKAQGWIQSNGI